MTDVADLILAFELLNDADKRLVRKWVRESGSAKVYPTVPSKKNRSHKDSILKVKKRLEDEGFISLPLALELGLVPQMDSTTFKKCIMNQIEKRWPISLPIVSRIEGRTRVYYSMTAAQVKDYHSRCSAEWRFEE